MFSPNQVPPHISKNSPLRMQTKQFHVIPNTLFPCLPTPSPTSRPLYHQPSASRHPIIHTLTLQMSNTIYMACYDHPRSFRCIRCSQRGYHSSLVRRRNSTSAEEVARFQRLFKNLSWLTSGRTSRKDIQSPKTCSLIVTYLVANASMLLGSSRSSSWLFLEESGR